MKAYHLKINKKNLVKNESAEVINMRSFIQLEASMKAHIFAKQKFKFIIDEDIIETLIFGLLFSNSEEDGDEEYSFEQAKMNALKHFVHNHADNIFVNEVKSVLKLNMVTDFVSAGVSFRQASRLYQSVKDKTGMGVMDVSLFNHLNSVRAHLEMSLKTCKGFVGPLKSLCQGPAALNQISSSSIGQRIPAHKA